MLEHFSATNQFNKFLASMPSKGKRSTSMKASWLEKNVMAHELEIERVPRETNTVIGGNRTVQLGYVLDWALRLQSEHSAKCTLGKMQVVEEVRRGLGLVSEIVLICDSCGFETRKRTEDPKLLTSHLNYGAVWGITLSTGSTYSQMEEQHSCMNIPCMPYNKFHAIALELGDSWKDSLWSTMKAAGKEEYERAVEKGQFDSDGNVWITVYVDGGWSHRSYGHNYNAASGAIESVAPWKALLTSPNTWAIVLVHVTLRYADSQYAHRFAEEAYRFRSNNTMCPIAQAVILTMPNIWSPIVTVLSGLIFFNLAQNGVQKVNVHRIGTLISLVAALCHVPYNFFWERSPGYNLMIVSLLTVTMSTFLASGFLLHLEMAPNYAGTLMGLTMTLAGIPSVVFMGVLGAEHWNHPKTYFSVGTIVVSMFMGIVYFSPELETYNNYEPLHEGEDYEIEY